MTGRLRLRHAAATDVGRVRHQNEDSYLSGSGFYAVCDGMGGARAGEVASETACRLLSGLKPHETRPDDLRLAIEQANAAILEQSRRDPALLGMGTTLTAGLISDDLLLLGHVGDSRAYLLRGGELRQLTQDHSLVAEMVRMGRLSPEQAAVHPHRSVITRALGTEEIVHPDLQEMPVEAGDRLLFCSDGLSGMVANEEIKRILSEAADPQAAADALVAAALDSGGEDNITVVVAFADEPDGEEAPEGQGQVTLGPARRAADEGPGAVVASALARLRSRRMLVSVTLAVVVLALLAGVSFAFLSTVYFVGTSDGSVALFNGIPYHVLGLQLYRVVEVGQIKYDGLASYVKSRVDAHELVSREEGQRFLRSLGNSS